MSNVMPYGPAANWRADLDVWSDGARRLDAVNGEYLDALSPLVEGATAFSLPIWARPSATGQIQQLWQNRGGTVDGLRITDVGALQGRLRTASDTLAANSANNIVTAIEWQLFGVTWNLGGDRRMRIYRNGVQVAQSSAGTADALSSNLFRFGRHSSDGDNFDGRMFPGALFAPLTDAEWLELFAAGDGLRFTDLPAHLLAKLTTAPGLPAGNGNWWPGSEREATKAPLAVRTVRDVVGDSHLSYASLPTIDHDPAHLNGNFASDTLWTKGAGWSIASGVATIDGSQPEASDLYQDNLAVATKRNEITFTITSHTAGSVTPIIGGQLGTARSSAGTFIETIRAGSTNARIGFRASADAELSIDNVRSTSLESLPANGIPAGLASPGDVIQQQQDQSPNARHLWQTTAVRKPELVEVGGLRAVRYPGINHWLELLEALDIWRDAPDAEIFIALRPLSTATVQMALRASTASSGNVRLVLDYTNTQYRLGVRRLDADSQTTLIASEAPALEPQLLEAAMLWSDGEGRITLDGTQIAVNETLTSEGNTSDTNSASFTVGAGLDGANPLHADVHEIALYRKRLTELRRKVIRGILRERWSLNAVVNYAMSGIMQPAVLHIQTSELGSIKRAELEPATLHLSAQELDSRKLAELESAELHIAAQQIGSRKRAELEPATLHLAAQEIRFAKVVPGIVRAVNPRLVVPRAVNARLEAP